MKINDYRELSVWQKSMDFVTEIYKLTAELPKDELFGLASQMRRAAVSVPSNIAEGQQRNSVKDFTRFLVIARGSCAELQTQLLITVRLSYFQQNQIQAHMQQLQQIIRMINGLITAIN